MLHSQTRSRLLIDRLHNLGICISYDRLLSISTSLGNAVCKEFENEGLVCLPLLRRNVFTTHAVDNIGHNPSSRTAKESWHGTAVSTTQHIVNKNDGILRERNKMENECSRIIRQLPSNYTNVLPFVLKIKYVYAPTLTDETILPRSSTDVFCIESEWLQYATEEVNISTENKKIMWPTYYSLRENKPVSPKAITCLMTLFRENAHTPAMIHHAMMLIKEQTSFLNKGQIPVMTIDQPLYALAKFLQWTKPDTLGEQHILVVIGDLHIEMTFMKCIGDLLDGSGWTFLLTSSMIVTTGKANAMLPASSNMVLCRYLHRVTACVLHKKNKKHLKNFQ